MIELLSPAGSPEGVIAAVQNGADAVYMGMGAFNARRGAKNFTDEEFVKAVRYCHVRGCKVYVTLNTLVNDREMRDAVAAAKLASDAGADALIVTGLQTGSAPTLDEVRKMKSLAHGRPVLIGSGIKDSTIAGYLSVADGVIVGSSIKKDGNVWNAVDAQRVRRLVDSAQGK